MNNKVLIKLLVIDCDISFDVFIPVNEIMWKVKKLLTKSVSDLTGISSYLNKDFILINKDNSRIYNNNEIIIDTDIRNGTEIIMLSN